MTVEEAIKQISEILKNVNIKNTSLIDKPSESELKYMMSSIDYGRNIHTEEPKYEDPTYWYYPEGVEEKIQDDKIYEVWFDFRDSSDPFNNTTWKTVKYIEEINPNKELLKKYFDSVINEEL